MTDRLSNIEIEDVLSSIRKLVSDDLRPGATSRGPVAPAVPRPTVPRLVLTAALRVPTAPPAAEAPSDVAPDTVNPVPLTPDEDSLASRLAELEVLMARQGHEFEDEGAPAVAAPRPASPPDIRPAAGFHAAAPLPDPAHLPPPREAPYLSGDDDDTATDDFSWTDSAPDPAFAERDAEPVSLLDEAVLRDLIRDVLREELQGAMGERVTRNLRKLVRAEIARSLTARGLT